jgi:hypothetical protein
VIRRKRRALDRLPNICTWIFCLPPRRDHFEETVQQLQPNSTVFLHLVRNVICWHGDADGLERVFLLREPLQEFMYIAIQEEQQEKSKHRRGQAQDTIDGNDPGMAMIYKLTMDH